MDKRLLLRSQLKTFGKVAIAFSGGVDSTFLLHEACEVLKDDVLAITVNSPLLPQREMEDAVSFVKQWGVSHQILAMNPLENEVFLRNPPDRCYYCKMEIFQKMVSFCREHGFHILADGSNVDDEKDYRPGRQALLELGIKSPLKENGFGKSEIRQCLKALGIKNFGKPAAACLASRFPYGTSITKGDLKKVEEAEAVLFSLGFSQFRVRFHGELARIEVDKEERRRFLDQALMDQIVNRFKEIGFTFITLDLEGYRMGSLNEVL